MNRECYFFGCWKSSRTVELTRKLESYIVWFKIYMYGFEDTNPRKIKMIKKYMKSGKANTLEKAKRMANKALR